MIQTGSTWSLLWQTLPHLRGGALGHELHVGQFGQRDRYLCKTVRKQAQDGLALLLQIGPLQQAGETEQVAGGYRVDGRLCAVVI